jgi:hypothetical protein
MKSVGLALQHLEIPPKTDGALNQLGGLLQYPVGTSRNSQHFSKLHLGSRCPSKKIAFVKSREEVLSKTEQRIKSQTTIPML